MPLLPIGTVYDPFVTRALAPEGGAHQPIVTPSIGLEQPQCVGWEPCFTQYLEWTFLHALGRIARPDGSSAYFRLSTRTIDQSLADIPADPAARGFRFAGLDPGVGSDSLSAMLDKGASDSPFPGVCDRGGSRYQTGSGGGEMRIMDIRAGRDRRRTWHAAAVGVLAAGLLAGVGGVEARQVPRAVSTEPLATVTVSPYRILDTRSGIGAPVGALGAEASIDVQIAGVGPVPANAVGVVLNLTSNQASAAGYVTAWPTGEERPTASVLNVTPGIDLPNMVTLALGTGGKVSLYNFTGSVHLIADVAAYLITGGGGIGPQGPPGPPGPSGPTHHTLVVAGAGWTPNTSVSIVHRAYGCTPLTTDLLLLDLPLPGGAVINKVSVAYGDAATNNGVRVTLQIAGVSTYLDGGSTSSSVMGTLPTTLATMSFTPPSALPGASLESASPVLWAMPAAAGAPNGAVEVCGVEVAYTLPPS